MSPDPFVALARASFTAYTQTGTRIAVPEGLPTEFYTTQAACFVSLHEGGQLRGCIGTIAPTKASLADEIIDNAIAACSRDPRFSPVRPDELPAIECKVDVLTAPEPIEGSEQLDPRRFGVIVSCGMRRGVLLPDLEGIDTVEEQLAIARRKAGIAEGEPCTLERFEVVRHS